ncbi:hypothetical protein HK104_000799 [Borealophlyctis nickersoniae]|nr:hypothetical protein HK104_000799 [Borealophlyctis nickersoniae]
MPTEILKIVLLGDGGVGKTALRNQFIHRRFTATYKATIGADFVTKEVDAEGRNVALQIWDTAGEYDFMNAPTKNDTELNLLQLGQERFQSLGVAFYRGADACMWVRVTRYVVDDSYLLYRPCRLVYDVTKPSSLASLPNWLSQFIRMADISDSHTFPFILIGNKIDMESSRTVSKRQGRDMARILKKESIEIAKRNGRVVTVGGFTQRHDRESTPNPETRLLSARIKRQTPVAFRGQATTRLFGVGKPSRSVADSGGGSGAMPTSSETPISEFDHPNRSASMKTHRPNHRDSVASQYTTASEFPSGRDSWNWFPGGSANAQQLLQRPSAPSEDGSEWFVSVGAPSSVAETDQSSIASTGTLTNGTSVVDGSESQEGVNDDDEGDEDEDEDGDEEAESEEEEEPEAGLRNSGWEIGGDSSNDRTPRGPLLTTTPPTPSTPQPPSLDSELPLFEASAKLGIRVEEAFAYIARTVQPPRFNFEIVSGDGEIENNISLEDQSARRRVGSSCAC